MIEPKQTPNEMAKRSVGKVVPFRPAPSSSQEVPVLTFTWDMLERQLSDLAVTARQRALVQTLVSGTRKQAPFKPSEQVLREVLCIASVLMDETFHPESDQPNAGEGEMT